MSISEEPPETTNDYGVGQHLGSGDVVFLLPLPHQISQEKALRLAAWIVAITMDRSEFDRILKAVLAT